MEDQLFDDPAPEGTPAAPEATPPDQQSQQIAALTEQVQALATQNQGLISKLGELAAEPAPQPPPPPAPAPDPNDRVNDLARDPDLFVGDVADTRIQAAIQEQIGPVLQQQMETMGESLLQQHEANIDGQFGAGTFEAVFKPQLDQDIANLKAVNPRAVADPKTIGALVDRVFGPNYAALKERESAHTKTMEEQRVSGIKEIASQVPQGGVPRLRGASGDNAGELPDDVKEFVQETDSKTGQRTDTDRFKKLYHSGTQTGPGRHRTSLEDYLDATGAKPEQKSQYGL